MLRATSPAPPQFLKESQPDTPSEKQKGFRVDSDGCSTAAPSPMTEMHPSPWGTPSQGLTSPDCRTSDDSHQDSPWNPNATAAPQSSGLTASFPFRNMYEKFGGLSVVHCPPPWSPVSAVTTPPPVTEAAWLAAEDALSQALLGAESVQPAAAVTPQTPPQTPPRTPRKPRTLCGNPPDTAPWAPKKFTAVTTQMSRALQSDSISAAKEALSNDPDAAWTPFWEGSWEPPLCCAVRRICDPAIVSLLLEHQADANAEDRDGQTALALLNATTDAYPRYDLLPRCIPFSETTSDKHSPDSVPAVSPSREERVQRIAGILIEAGALIDDR